MIIAFTGTQRGMTSRQLRLVERRLTYWRPVTVAHGACIGADDEFDQIAARLGIYRLVYPSDIVDKSIPAEVLRQRGPCTIWPPDRPLKRNIRVVAAGTLLLACPAQATEVLRSGTWATVRVARRRGSMYEVIAPYGRDE